MQNSFQREKLSRKQLANSALENYETDTHQYQTQYSHVSAAWSLTPERSNTYVSDHGIKRGLWLVAVKIKHNSDPQKIDPNRLNDSILKAHGAPGNELRNMEGNSALENSWCRTTFWLPNDIVNLSKGFKYKLKTSMISIQSMTYFFGNDR